MSPADISRFGNGMNAVFIPQDGPGDDADPARSSSIVVFIHGLFGHPWKTWAYDSSRETRKPFWPQDILPPALDNKAAIYSFGYDADVERFMAAAGLNTVHQHGRNLLNDLRNLLDSLADSEPCLLFVVHSLGGLVLKEALNQSSASTDPKLQRVVSRTQGIIFLGTPHRGSSVASYGKIAFTLTRILASQSANTKLLRGLEKHSETLDRITTSFYETTTKHPNLCLFSFYEEKEIRRGFWGTRIVPPECAKIGHEREEIGSIPADHRYMAKFTSSSEIGFVRVSNILKRWIKTRGEEVSKFRDLDYIDCLKSLDQPEARARISQVSERHRQSFEWLFSDAVPFSEWLADDAGRYSPIFWITGKPGSGKSTLMRFAMQDPRLLDILPAGSGRPMGYFFHLRGTNMIQKSLRGMLQELLYQLLSQFPGGFEAIRAIYHELVAHQRKPEPDWSTSDLRSAFFKAGESILQQATRRRQRYILFIDALDENIDQSDNAEVLDLVETLASWRRDGPVLKICLASRPWPIFQKRLGNNKRIKSFAMHDFTRSDIASFVGSELGRAFSGGADPEEHRKLVRALSDVITEKARGVFIWVRVVLKELCQNIVDGSPPSDIERYISALPEELNDLYEHTMNRISSRYSCQTLAAFKILLSSRRQLNLAEIYAATMIAQAPDPSKEAENLEAEVTLQVIPPDRRIAWLESRTGGLVELVGREPGKDPRAADDDAVTDIGLLPVQLIHQTANEFLRNGIRGLQKTHISEWLLETTGEELICRAITARFPPAEPLWELSLDLLAYLKALNDDASIDDAHFAKIIDKTPSTWFQKLKVPHRFRRWSHGKLLTYLLPLSHHDDYCKFIKQLQGLSRRKTRLEDLPTFTSLVCKIVHGLYRAPLVPLPSLKGLGSQHMLMLLYVAVFGPRFGSRNGDRTEQVRRFPFHLLERRPPKHKEGLWNVPDGSLFNIGALPKFVSRTTDGNLIGNSLIAELCLVEGDGGHGWLREDERFEITRIILEREDFPWLKAHWLLEPLKVKTHVGPEMLMTLLEYATRFKQVRWRDLIHEHWPVLWELDKTYYTLHDRALLPHDPNAAERFDPCNEREPSWHGWREGLILVGMTSGFPGCPRLASACINGATEAKTAFYDLIRRSLID